MAPFLKILLSVAVLHLHTVLTVRGQHNPNFLSGRTTIVHLFEWKWNDIAEECENFLGPTGFGGVQVSPPTENVVVHNGNIHRPWHERYQPVSYKLETRSGTEKEFKKMVKRCNHVGVRIYVDAVINHMTGDWPNGTLGTGNSTFDSGQRLYDAVPYSHVDFYGYPECTTGANIQNYGDIAQVRNCMLLGLKDLNHNLSSVQEKILKFFNRLVSYGVAGFRLDASKHMWPAEMKVILDRVNNLSICAGFPHGTRPFIFQEVIDLGGEPIKAEEYVGNGRVTEFKYGRFLGEVLRGSNQARWLRNFGEGWGMLNDTNALVFIDNHDNQRGHGGGGNTILSFRVSRLYKMANAFMLAWPYGVTRIMSSYYWQQNISNGVDQNDWIGPPHDANYNIVPVIVNKDFSCGNGWVCEHRWREIYNMVKFRNAVQGSSVSNWWDNGSNQIAFCRTGKGFFALNSDNSSLSATIQTCLPEGTYCDVISGGLSNGKCIGKIIHVEADGRAAIDISNHEEDPMIAIHYMDKLPS